MQTSNQFYYREAIQIPISVKINDQNYTRGKETVSPFEYFVENNHRNQASLVDSS